VVVWWHRACDSPDQNSQSVLPYFDLKSTSPISIIKWHIHLHDFLYKTNAYMYSLCVFFMNTLFVFKYDTVMKYLVHSEIVVVWTINLTHF
jgi:hypothetical protein